MTSIKLSCSHILYVCSLPNLNRAESLFFHQIMIAAENADDRAGDAGSNTIEYYFYGTRGEFDAMMLEILYRHPQPDVKSDRMGFYQYAASCLHHSPSGDRLAAEDYEPFINQSMGRICFEGTTDVLTYPDRTKPFPGGGNEMLTRQWYTPPSPQEFYDFKKFHHLRDNQIASICGLSSDRKVRAWTSGEQPVPIWHWRILLMALAFQPPLPTAFYKPGKTGP